MIKFILKNKYIILILIFGLIIRVYNLTNLPAGFTADEASHGYDAYSLIQTGKDQWGQPWPIAFRSFGDFKLPIYTYLTIPFVLIGRLNELTVRLPAVLFGTLAILATYLFVNQLFTIQDQTSKSTTKAQWLNVAIISSLLLAISPWHIQLSRSAVEANLTSFFIPLALWTWLKGFSKTNNLKLKTNHNFWWVFTALLLGINLYTYHAARAFTLLIIPLLIWFTWQHSQANNLLGVFKFIQCPFTFLKSLFQKQNIILKLVKQNILPTLVFIVFLIPMGISLISGGSSRGLDVAIFNPTDDWRELSNLRHETTLKGFPDSLARLTTNKFTYLTKELAQNYVTYLSPYFLFIQGPGEATYGMLPGRGVLHWFELPLILFTIYLAIKIPNRSLVLLFAVILIAPLPAALSKGQGLAANRATPLLPFIHILSAYGLNTIINQLDYLKLQIKIFSYLLICSVVILFFSLFLKDYTIHAAKVQSKNMSYGWKQAVHKINQLADQYDHIIISRKFNQPHIFPMFYTPIKPSHIQQISPDWLTYDQQHLSFVDQLGEYQLDKFTFLEIQTEHLHQPRTLIVARPEDFLMPKPTILEVSRPSYPQSTPAIIFIDTRKIN